MPYYKIKKEMRAGFIEYCKGNSQDPFSFTSMKCALDAMEVLDNAANTCQQAEAVWTHMKLTQFHRACAARTVITFHVRGPEFEIYWDERNAPKLESGNQKTILRKGGANGSTKELDN